MYRFDRAGKVTYSVLALAILLLANLSSVYVFEVQRKGYELASQVNEIRAMEDYLEMIRREVELSAYYIAMGAIRESTQGPFNNSELNELFSKAFSVFVEQNFPISSHGCWLLIESYRIVILTDSKYLVDVDGGTVGEGGQDSMGYPRAFDVVDSESLDEVNRVSYFRLNGYVNYSISRGENTLALHSDIDNNLDSPYPFIEQQLNQYANLAQGPISEMSRALSYILTSIAQYRVLNGYAGGEYGEAGTTTFDVLTPYDIEVAVNLVLILEQLRKFRTINQDSIAQFDEAFFRLPYQDSPHPIANPSVENRTLLQLLGSLPELGYADASDVVALFYAMDNNDVPMNRLLAQTIYAISDQIVLKYLDYVDFLPIESIGDFGLGVLETLAMSFEGFLAWVSGQDKETEMVCDYIRVLFQDLGFAPTVAGPTNIRLPNRSFIVTNGDGTEFTISVPSNQHQVPFEYISFLDRKPELWKSYFSTLYKYNLKKVHQGIKDFVKDTARKIAFEVERTKIIEPVSLNGEIRITDDVGLIEQLEERITSSVKTAMHNIHDNKGIINILIENLWNDTKSTIRGVLDFIKSNYSQIVDPSVHFTFARNALAASLNALASKDPQYSSLDATGRTDLNNQILQMLDGGNYERLPYDQIRINDFSRLELLYSKASSMNTPPKEGGIYRRLTEIAVGSTGFIGQAGDYIIRFLTEMMRNEEISGNEYGVTYYSKPFQFLSSKSGDSGDMEVVIEEELDLDQNPDVLKSTKIGIIDDEDVVASVGELWIELINPSTVPVNEKSQNVHYTQVNGLSERAYETQWSVRIRGAVQAKVTTIRGIFIDSLGHVPAEDTCLVPLDMELLVKTYSGWPLLGVEYKNSNSLSKDVWNAVKSFLEHVWDAVTSVFGWVLEGAKFLLDKLSSLIDFLLSQASKALESVYNAFTAIIDFLQNVLKNAIAWLLKALDFIICHLPSFDFDVSAFGMSLKFQINAPNGNRLILSAGIGSFHLTVRFLNLEESGYHPGKGDPKWDVLSDWDCELGSLAVQGRLDPLMVAYDRILSAAVIWEESWKLRITIPEIEVYHETSIDFFTPPIQTPFGVLELEIGLRIRMMERVDGSNIFKILETSLKEAEEGCGGLQASWTWLKDFAETLVKRFLRNLVGALESIVDNVLDLSFYFQGIFKWGDLAGTGVRFTIFIDGPGVKQLFLWLLGNLEMLLENMINPASAAEYHELPPQLPSHVYLYADILLTLGLPTFIMKLFPDGLIPEMKLALGIGVSLSILGAIVGLDWGDWEIRFGGRLESIPPYIANPVFFTGDKTVDLWLFRGTLLKT